MKRLAVLLAAAAAVCVSIDAAWAQDLTYPEQQNVDKFDVLKRKLFRYSDQRLKDAGKKAYKADLDLMKVLLDRLRPKNKAHAVIKVRYAQIETCRARYQKIFTESADAKPKPAPKVVAVAGVGSRASAGDPATRSAGRPTTA